MKSTMGMGKVFDGSMYNPKNQFDMITKPGEMMKPENMLNPLNPLSPINQINPLHPIPAYTYKSTGHSQHSLATVKVTIQPYSNVLGAGLTLLFMFGIIFFVLCLLWRKSKEKQEIENARYCKSIRNR